MKRPILIFLGTFSLFLGIIGIILPVMPTSPFLLISLTCYMKSSRRLYNFVLYNKYLGPFVKDYVSELGMPVKAKMRAILFIWISIAISGIFIVNHIILRLILLVFGSSITLFIYTRKTRCE
ncbi:YbaN family protein [Serpentinicella sp. ANB-PHB4]|uniref:YbaN family protein n=1 Tax=Serpentinicella sp. ANB-PHB4 TaxID=3074076 RepID=UPI0028606D6F|nr:YbaN family protein [Serpentinicella sp. ANB-PHB4]MDR5659979.1 YbaN family protein [Serpentinicella sp. ANB-PHB4]